MIFRNETLYWVHGQDVGQNVPEMLANFRAVGEGHEKEMEGCFISGKASLEAGCKVLSLCVEGGKYNFFHLINMLKLHFPYEKRFSYTIAFP